MNEVRDIFVSVIMITYKHEQFIAKAIEGVLMQKCDFEVELIIADDCSPDKTEEKVFQIIKNHPKNSWIKYTKHKTNKGMISNFNWALNQCKGKYIAMCEGDDYWTDPLKLQKQVDFLEKTRNIQLASMMLKLLIKIINP
jgi:glycosyltransferase involved in cell wall biosynthesis